MSIFTRLFGIGKDEKSNKVDTTKPPPIQSSPVQSSGFFQKMWTAVKSMFVRSTPQPVVRQSTPQPVVRQSTPKGHRTGYPQIKLKDDINLDMLEAEADRLKKTLKPGEVLYFKIHGGTNQMARSRNAYLSVKAIRQDLMTYKTRYNTPEYTRTSEQYSDLLEHVQIFVESEHFTRKEFYDEKEILRLEPAMRRRKLRPAKKDARARIRGK